MLKLPIHNRYEYVPIVKRRDYTWPQGMRLAFYVALNVEDFAFMAGRGNDPYLRTNSPQTQRNYAWRDYGLRVGIWRIFGLLKELNLPATILLNSLVCENYPDVVAHISERGDDVCNHGGTNAERLGDVWEHDEARIIAESTETITKHFGARPTGWMGPGAAETRVTPDLLKEAGYTHNLGWPVDDQPIWLRTRAGLLLSIPYPMELNDMGTNVLRDHSGRDFADMIVDQSCVGSRSDCARCAPPSGTARRTRVRTASGSLAQPISPATASACRLVPSVAVELIRRTDGFATGL